MMNGLTQATSFFLGLGILHCVNPGDKQTNTRLSRRRRRRRN